MTEPTPSPSLLRRLTAMFYDSLLALALLLATTFIVIAVRYVTEGADSMPPGQPAISGAWKIPSFLVNLLTLAVFFAYFWVRNGQTLGMQTWRMQVVDDVSGGNLSWKQAFIRFAAALLSAGCFGLGYLWVVFDKNKKSWHDHLSHSHLVLLPKKKKS